jgi:zinc transporter 1
MEESDDTSIGKSTRYWIILWLTVLFCIVEVVVAIMTNSLALLSEGFHNIGDVATLWIAAFVDQVPILGFVGLFALFLSNSTSSFNPTLFNTQTKGKKSNDQYSYGYQRAEVVGALVNGVSLLALCFFVVLEAIPRFVVKTRMIKFPSSSGSVIVSIYSGSSIRV